MGKTPGEIREDLHGQLSAVEKLQYQLTSHELQFAQRMAQSEQQAAEKVEVTVVSSSSDSNEGKCSWSAVKRFFDENQKSCTKINARDLSAFVFLAGFSHYLSAWNRL